VIMALKQTMLCLEHRNSVIPAGTMLLIAGHLRPAFQAHTGRFLIADLSEEVVRRYLRFCTLLSGMAVSPSSLLLQIRPQMSVLAECLIRQLITDEPSPVYFRDAVAFSSLALFEEHPDFHALLTGCIRSCTVRVKNIISADLSRPWMLGEVASLLYISESLLKKKLQEELTTFSELLLKERMQYAAQLLSAGENRISRVAELCGYASASYFISVFRRYYGITPNQWLPVMQPD
ncbi:AraC family transcriptional regulator, partial [Escherichia coli]|uniref:AraC family transcriptional regulator n=2 Tax=Escherichia coli TaxID=562 RepID=UPI00203CEE1A